MGINEAKLLRVHLSTTWRTHSTSDFPECPRGLSAWEYEIVSRDEHDNIGHFCRKPNNQQLLIESEELSQAIFWKCNELLFKIE